MSALKKIFGGGDARDEEIMYRTEGQSAATEGTGTGVSTGGSTATENVDREIQSSRDIGTGAQDNPGFISKATDTSNVESQFANTSSTTSSSNPPVNYARESNPPVTYAQESNTERNTALAGAGTAGAGAAAVVYASDRAEGDSGQDDISKATYTERSYPLASESSVAQYPTGYSRDPNAPGAVGETPGHVPGEFPSDEGRDPVSNPGVTSTSTDSSYGRDAAIAGGATAAAGAAGYGAYSASDSRSTEFDPVSNPGVSSTSADRSYGTDENYASAIRGTDSQRTTTDTRHQTGIASVIDPRAQDTDTRKVNETHYGRDTAAAGAVTGVGAGAGYAATRDNDDAYRAAGTDERQVQEVESHYGRDAAATGAVLGVGAGAGYAATRDNDDAYRSAGTDERKFQETETQYDRDAAGAGSEPGMKQGFFSKAFHGPRKDEEVPIGDHKPSNEIQRSEESTLAGSDRTPGLPHDDSGLITLHKEGSDPTAPALVIREKPGGGVETVPRE